MRTQIISIPKISTNAQQIAVTIIAIGLGVSLPRIFHIFGLGHIFLPMFLPLVLIGAMLSIPFLVLIAVVTPFLSTILFGMPPYNVTLIMAVQLTIVGTLMWLFRQTKMPLWSIPPSAILSERLLTIGTSLLIPSLNISTERILDSYPGILMLSFFGIITAKFYER